MVSGSQVDGLGPDGAQGGRHLQPQLVAVHPQRADGAGPLPGVDLVAGGSFLPHFLPRPVPLLLRLHLVALNIGPPARRSRRETVRHADADVDGQPRTLLEIVFNEWH